MSAIRPRQERFCQYFVLDPNATNAAAHAGYARRTAGKQGSRLLANSRVPARIVELPSDIVRRHCAHAHQLIATLAATDRPASALPPSGAARPSPEHRTRLGAR